MSKWSKYLAPVFLSAVLAASCGGKNSPQLKQVSETQPSKPAPSSNLQDKLRILELRFEILQKDNPPQVDSGAFRLSIGEAKELMARNKAAEAENKLRAAQTWLDLNEQAYYLAHQDEINRGKSKDSAAQLWAEAEKFWAKENEAFSAGDKRAAGLWGTAGFGEGELAADAAMVSDLPVAEKVGYCLKLSDRHASVDDNVEALKWKTTSKKLIDDRVSQLATQINWCLSGTVPMCDQTAIRASEEDYAKAKKSVIDSWAEAQQLTKTGNAIFPGQFSLPDLPARITEWTSANDTYWARFAANNKPQPFKDYLTQQQEERTRQQAIIDKYNRIYCSNTDDAGKLGLKLSSTDIKMIDKNLEVRVLFVNNNSEPIFKPRVRLCGGLVSDETEVGYPKFPGNYQASFSVTTTGFIMQSSNQEEFQLPPYWALVIFEDAKGNRFRAKAILKQ